MRPGFRDQRFGFRLVEGLRAGCGMECDGWMAYAQHRKSQLFTTRHAGFSPKVARSQYKW